MSEGWQTSAGSGPDSRGEAATPSHPPPAHFPTHAITLLYSPSTARFCQTLACPFLVGSLPHPCKGLTRAWLPPRSPAEPWQQGQDGAHWSRSAGGGCLCAAGIRDELRSPSQTTARKTTRGSRLLTSVNVRKASPGEGAARVVLPMRM